MKFSKSVLSIALMTISVAAFAGTSDIKASNNQVGIQLIGTNVNYKETGNGTVGAAGKTLDTENGNVNGFALTASVMRDLWLGNDYMAAEYSRNSGSTGYVGSAQGGVYGSVVRSSGATMNDYSFRYGKGFSLSEQVMLTPYGEIGHHQWYRGVNLGETYTNSYYGVGVMGQYSPIPKLVMTANGFVGSTARSNIDVTGIGSANLGNSGLYRIGLSADYAITAKIHGNVGVDYTSFKYGASAWQSLGGGLTWAEPNSSTNNTTVKAGLGYAF